MDLVPQLLQQVSVVVERQLVGNFIQSEEPGVGHIIGRVRRACNGDGKVNHQIDSFTRVTGGMKDREEAFDVDRHTRLLVHLPHRGLLGSFPVVLKSGRKPPSPPAGGDPTPHHQDLAVAQYDRRSRRRGILENDEVAHATSLALTPKCHAHLETSTANQAESCALFGSDHRPSLFYWCDQEIASVPLSPHPGTMKRVAILGSTGSVGTNALRIIAANPDRFAVAALVAHRAGDALVDQAATFHPQAVCLASVVTRPPGLDAAIQYATGADGILEALEASRPDIVLNAITGAAGLRASEWTLRQGLPLALANKESLVMAGPYLMDLARATNATILPVDSEHCAIFQCLAGEPLESVRQIYLTASGGPFRTLPAADFPRITREQALKHPTWEMGPRITIGSATLMNKAFEILEARWLFGLAPEQIQVLVHPQSIVHSMVEFVDGSMLAQLGLPDMRVPILYCLAHPERIPFDFEPFDPVRFAQLDFENVDTARFASIPLAYEVLAQGGTSGAVLNAADEVMTEMFLAGKVDFPAITATVAQVVHDHTPQTIHSLEDVLAADAAAREAARTLAHH